MTRTTRLALACAVAAAAFAVVAPGASARRATGPGYTSYRRPNNAGGHGEPTLGVSWRTGTVMFQDGLQTLAVTFDGKGAAHWTNRTAIQEQLLSLDPILETDTPSGRTFVSQLTADCSLLSWTDDDGQTWNPSTGCGPGVYVDHQTVGVGPYAKPLPVTRVLPDAYPHAVYYCAQALAEASCARSDDGGTTFGPATVMYRDTTCGGLHGHLRVGPDGTAYLAHQDCLGHQGVVVSEDNGATWSVRTVPGSRVNAESDPSVAVGRGGTAYFGYEDGAGNASTRAMVATTRDHGRTWSQPVDVGSRLGIKNVQFPEMIAGDDDRAAFAFLGTTRGGNDQVDTFAGDWHIYVATTYDGGRTWTTVDAAPGDIVQRGCIKITPTGCSHRNLLDFNDIAVDRQGRVYLAWTDGCPAVCEKSRTQPWSPQWNKPVLTRQTRGKGLFRAFDGKI